MDHAEFLRQAEKTFGMADKEVAAGIETVPDLVDQALLFRLIEIDHHVAAENDVVAPGKKFGLQIVKVELHKLFELPLDRILVVGFFEVAEAGGVINRLHLDLGVNPLLTGTKAAKLISEATISSFHGGGMR